jgi:hypothetical protein
MVNTAVPPRSVHALAADLREALQAADTRQLRSLLHPQVLWAGTGPGDPARHGRADALTWYRVRYDRGVRTRAEETFAFPAAIVLALRITDPGETARPSLYYRVFQLRSQQITHIRDYTERAHALEAASRGATADRRAHRCGGGYRRVEISRA